MELSIMGYYTVSSLGMVAQGCNKHASSRYAVYFSLHSWPSTGIRVATHGK